MVPKAGSVLLRLAASGRGNPIGVLGWPTNNNVRQEAVVGGPWCGPGGTPVETWCDGACVRCPKQSSGPSVSWIHMKGAREWPRQCRENGDGVVGIR